MSPQAFTDLKPYMATSTLRISHTETDGYSRLGENPFTMAALQSLLADRITAGDIDGSLVISILKVRLSPVAYDYDC